MQGSKLAIKYFQENNPIEEWDVLQAFFRTISKIEFLTVEQEKAYFEDYYDEGNPTTYHNPAIRNTIILSNLRFLVKKAFKFQRDNYTGDLTLMDLVQEGYRGFEIAFDNFKPELGYRYLTYAEDWLYQCMQRAVDDTGRTIRIPPDVPINLGKIQKYIELVRRQDRNYVPTIGDLAAALNLPKKTIHKTLKAQRLYSLTSLDATVEDDRDLYSSLDNETPSIHDEVHNNELTEVINDHLDMLSDREANILRMRFGIDQEPMSLEECGIVFHVSRERIRKIEKEALVKLSRKPGLKNLAKDYL